MNLPFVNLHGHSNASIMDAIGTPEEIFDFIVKNDMNASALTDHGHMNSYVSAYLAQKDLNKKMNFKYIPGCEFYFHPDLDKWKEDYIKQKEEKKKKKKQKKEQTDDEITGTVENEEETKSGKYFDPIKRRHHLIALAKNNIGLKNMFSLVSKGYKDGFYRFPRIDFKDLKEYGEGIILSSACLGTIFGYPLFRHFPENNIDTLVPDLLEKDLILKEKILNDMENLVERFVDAVGKENFFLEIQFNKLSAQHLLNKALIETSKRTGIKLLASSDYHYSNPDLWQSRELYKKLGWLKFNNFEPGQIPQSKEELKAELYPKNGQQMWDAYKETTKNYDFYNDDDVKDAITITHDIAFDMIKNPETDRSVKLPSFAIEKDEEPFEKLTRLCREGMIKKGFSKNKIYIDRLKEELSLIKEKKFSLYFLTTKEIIDLAKERTLINFARGSGGGSLICYILGITNIDPIENNLSFFRFLNKYKTSWPDIDLDFANRDKVIKALKDKYGDENVIYISNFNLFKLKSLVKDVSKFWGIPYEEVNNHIKNLDKDVAQGSFKKTGDKILEPKLNDALQYSELFRKFIEKYPQVAEHIETLYKQTKTIGTHAGGIIIGDNLAENLPIIRSKGKYQTPWSESGNITHMEEMGWLKFDILGLETLQIIENCISHILERHEGIKNPTFDDIKKWYYHFYENLNKDDQKVFEYVYHKGNFCATFQFTEKPVQEYCLKVKPRSITDISAITSLFRPGPMQSGMHDLYLKNKQKGCEYENEIMREVLEETHNVYSFQEQIMELGHKLGKIPQDECDILRKVISKKPEPGSKAEQKAFALEDRFVKGSVENGLSEERAKEIFNDFKKFAKYSFNRSHSCAYSTLSYVCAYLFTYYESEWICAYVESTTTDPNEKEIALSLARFYGYKIENLDINKAESKWAILPNKKFMPPLYSVKSIGDKAVEEIEKFKPFNSIEDFWDENNKWKFSKFNKTGLGNLIKLEAFDSLNCVGENKLFKNYKHMHYVVIENLNELKKKKGKENLEELAIKNSYIEDWKPKEKFQMRFDLTGELDVELLLTDEIKSFFKKEEIKGIEEYEGPAKYWFYCASNNVRPTKTGKFFESVKVVSKDGKAYRLFVWNFRKGIDKTLKPQKIYCVDKLRFKEDFGFQATKENIFCLD